MGSYKWADVASSESCASFGRTTLMLLERGERYGTNKAYLECSNKLSEGGVGKSSHFMFLPNDSYIDKNSIPELHESKLNLNKININANAENAVTVNNVLDDDLLSPLLYTNSDLPLDNNPKSFANFLNNSTHTHNHVNTTTSTKSTEPSLTPRIKYSNNTTNTSNPNTSNLTHSNVNSNNVNPNNTVKADNVRNVNDSLIEEDNNGSISSRVKYKHALNTINHTNSRTSEEKPLLGKTSVQKGFVDKLCKSGEKRLNSSVENYYDEETNEIMNPTKKFKDGIKMSRKEKEEISKVLLTELNKKSKPSLNDDNTRFYSRLKDIAIGKATKGYQNYIRMVPKDERGPDDPQTPNTKNVSASKFRAMYRSWRTQLHKFDNLKH
uniref:Histone RNA hairpin-binding protein RNA-binding domain containing protein, putative n=1 Tax=Theileria annulata TaxID=5874 RepID=A0A3B0MXU6_THEAN